MATSERLAHVGRTDTLFSKTRSASSTAASEAPINRLFAIAMLAACTENKAIADKHAAAIAEEIVSATDRQTDPRPHQPRPSTRRMD
jgi:hypothetical protein